MAQYHHPLAQPQTYAPPIQLHPPQQNLFKQPAVQSIPKDTSEFLSAVVETPDHHTWFISAMPKKRKRLFVYNVLFSSAKTTL